MNQTGIVGSHAEKLAHKYLVKQGLRLQDKNRHSRFGEIDLIMWHDDYLVFVEVRYRRRHDFGGALESIDQRKQGKLRRSAQDYLMRTKNHDCPCRFDILCLHGDINNPDYQWIKNAF